MSRKEVALESIENINFEIKKLSKLQRKMAIVFIMLILTIALIALFYNLEKEAAPYMFMLFVSWILSHGAYSVLLVAQNTENKLQDIVVYSERLREYTVTSNESMLNLINKNKNKNKPNVTLMDLPLPPVIKMFEVDDPRVLGERERNGLLAIIGGMLRLMLDKTSDGKSNSVYINQGLIIEALIAHYGVIDGISKTSLELKFPIANRLVKNAMIRNPN